MQKADFLAYLKQLADGIVAMFGRNCEVAVHDLRNLESSLVYLAGDVTGRSTGAPATDLLVRALNQKGRDMGDMVNYKTHVDGRAIKSSTFFLRDENKKVIAAFCINLDTTDFFNAAQTLAPFLNNTAQPREGVINETFANSVGETTEALFEQALNQIGKQPATMTTAEKTTLIAILEKEGIFKLKGAVNRVAKLAGVTKYTVYNYLKKIRNAYN